VYTFNKDKLQEDEIYKTNTVVLYPTESQKEFLDKCIDLYRFTYNWTIEQKEIHYKRYKDGLEDSALIQDKTLIKRFSEFRKSNDWLKIIPMHTLRNAIYDAIDAYERFFTKRIKTKPKYKSKKTSKKSFAPEIQHTVFYFKKSGVHIAGLHYGETIQTKINTDLCRMSNKRFRSARIVHNSMDRYILTYVTIEKKPIITTDMIDNKYNRAIGIDLNVKNLIVTSYNDGEIFKAIDMTHKEKQIKHYQRLCKKDFDRTKRINQERANLDQELLDKSNNAKKRSIILAKKYKKISNTNDTYIKTIAKKVVSRLPKAIVMEDLKIRKIQKENKYVAKYISKVPLYKIRKVFEYNCEKYNVPFILADKDFPSTQLCSRCGHKKDLKGYKYYVCNNCGLRLNRDINASLNLEKLAYC